MPCMLRALRPVAVPLAPTQVDALDCVTLDYCVGWPLSAIITEVRARVCFCLYVPVPACPPARPPPCVRACRRPCFMLGFTFHFATRMTRPENGAQKPSERTRHTSTSPLSPRRLFPRLQDTVRGYSAVFSMMVRVRRCEQLLRALHAPLASQAKSTADLLLRCVPCAPCISSTEHHQSTPVCEWVCAGMGA